MLLLSLLRKHFSKNIMLIIIFLMDAYSKLEVDNNFENILKAKL